MGNIDALDEEDAGEDLALAFKFGFDVRSPLPHSFLRLPGLTKETTGLG